MHLTEEQLQRLLHGEETGQDTLSHLAECAECQAKVSSAREDEAEILGLLEAVDRDPPPLAAGDIARAAPTSRREPGRVRWAAVILLACMVGGVAYALPGSPLRSWLTRLFDAESTTVIDSTSIAPETPPQSAVSGIAVAPGAVLTIVFDPPRKASHARVIVSDEAQVSVEGPVGQVRFTSEPDRLLVALLADSVMVQVRIPRLATRVVLRLGDRTVLVKRGTTIDSPYPADSILGYLLPLAP